MTEDLNFVLRARREKLDAIRAAGIEAFRQSIALAAPPLADRVHELKSWDDVKLLTVAVDRPAQWYNPGMPCIGAAAHAMPPRGAVGRWGKDTPPGWGRVATGWKHPRGAGSRY